MNLTVVEHKTFNTIKKFSLEDAVNALKEAIELIDCAKSISEIINEYEQNLGSDFAIDNLIDDLDGVYEIPVTNFENYGVGHASIKSEAINKSIAIAMERKKSLFNRINKITLAGVAPKKEVLEDLKKQVFNLIGFSAYFICYEFDLYSLAVNSEDAEVDSAFYSYCQSKVIDPVEYAMELSEISTEYRISLGVFEDYPELEKPFMDIVGPEINLIDENVLTTEMVIGVIQGSISVEDLMTKVSLLRDDSDDSCDPVQAF